jgi:hypothetical protein
MVKSNISGGSQGLSRELAFHMSSRNSPQLVFHKERQLLSMKKKLTKLSNMAICVARLFSALVSMYAIGSGIQEGGVSVMVPDEEDEDVREDEDEDCEDVLVTVLDE